MARELNPNLFDNKNGTEQISLDRAKELIHKEVNIEQVRQLTLQMEAVMKKCRELDSKVDTTQQQLHRTQEQFQKRVEALISHHKKLEENVKGSFQDLREKFALTVAKVKESQMGELKQQQLMDRHNQIVQSFESRMLQMQKLVTDQEMQLLSFKSLLKDKI